MRSFSIQSFKVERKARFSWLFLKSESEFRFLALFRGSHIFDLFILFRSLPSKILIFDHFVIVCGEICKLRLVTQLVMVVEGVLSFTNTQALVLASIYDHTSEAGVQSRNGCHSTSLTSYRCNILHGHRLYSLFRILIIIVLRSFLEIPNMNYTIFWTRVHFALFVTWF
jgi:hypothetical protein